MSEVSNSPAPTFNEKPKRKKRVRNFTPSDRAQHRILEKERREAFNAQMMELARLLHIEHVRQLSKHIIVRDAIKQITNLQTERKAAAQGIQALIAERDQLLLEINQTRLASQTLPPQTLLRKAIPLHESVNRLLRPSQHSRPSSNRSLTSGTDNDDDHDIEHESGENDSMSDGRFQILSKTSAAPVRSNPDSNNSHHNNGGGGGGGIVGTASTSAANFTASMVDTPTSASLAAAMCYATPSPSVGMLTDNSQSQFLGCSDQWITDSSLASMQFNNPMDLGAFDVNDYGTGAISTSGQAIQPFGGSRHAMDHQSYIPMPWT